MADRQPDECAAGEWIRVGRPLAAEVGEEQQPLTAGRDTGGRRDEVVVRDAGRDRVAQPAQAPGRRQHHAHQVPPAGDRMAEGVEPAVRLDDRGVRRREHDPGRAERQCPDPGHHRADANRVRGLVAAARDDGCAGSQSRGRGGLFGDPASHRRALVRRGQPSRIDPQRVDELRRPGPRREVEQHRAGAIGDIGGGNAGEPPAEVVLWHRRDPCPDLRLVAPDPEELRGGEAGERVVAGDRDEPLAPDDRPDLVAFGRRALVVPQDRRPKDLAVAVQRDEAVHLAGQPDRLNVGPIKPCRRQRAADRRDAAVPPQPRVLFGP